MSSFSWFIGVLISKHASSRFCNTWAQAVASLCTWFQAVFHSQMQWSHWRWFSSASHNCKITERVHSHQVIFYTEESTSAWGFMYCRYLPIPSAQRTVIISSTFRALLRLANEHKLYYFIIFYSSLAHPYTDFLEHGSKHRPCPSNLFGDLGCSLYSLSSSV